MSSSPYLHSPTSPVSFIFVFKCPFFLYGFYLQPVLLASTLSSSVLFSPWLQSPASPESLSPSVLYSMASISNCSPISFIFCLGVFFNMASISNYSPISFIFVSKCPLLFNQILYASDPYLIHLLNNITLHDPCKVVGMNCISVSVFDFQVAFPLWCQEVCLQLHHQHRHSLGSRQCILYQ